MATWNNEMTRCERPASTSRLRDFLVMAAFSLAALVAAFAFVQFKYGDVQFKYGDFYGIGAFGGSGGDRRT